MTSRVISPVKSRTNQLRLESFKAKMLRIKQDYAEGKAFDLKVLSEIRLSLTQKDLAALPLLSTCDFSLST